MSNFNSSQWLGFVSKQRFYLFVILIIPLLAFFYLAYGVAYADLTTQPPSRLQVEQTNQKKIESLLIKARMAISENRFMVPKKYNSVYYLSQILILSPDNKQALSTLTEVFDTYTGLAYIELDKKNIKLAQRYHKNAKKIAHQFTIKTDQQVLVDLQEAITKRQVGLHQLSEANKLLFSDKKIKQKKQLMNELADLQREISVSQSMMNQYREEIKSNNKAISLASKAEESTQVKSEQTTTDVSKSPALSPAERERIVVIINKDNKITSLTIKELKALYKEQKRTWSNGEAVTLYLPLPNSDAFVWLTRHVFLKKSATSVMQFYMKGLNSNKLKIPVTPSNSVLDVSRKKGAIAIVKAGEVERSDTVKIISINGI
ncbi:MAG: hypothetical protein KAH20_10935 [Methylococcales bacterium]|nr:hypothetical protein [Methylococcales bacterium]